jgi:hypothetical protein
MAVFSGMLLYGQAGFSSEAYMDFIEQNRSLTTEQLLSQYPPHTDYYASRTQLPVLGDIPWFDSIDAWYKLTDAEKSLLRNNYFMVTERLNLSTWDAAFAQIYSNDLPLFLSTDFILFTLHQSYDEILKRLEYRMLEPNLLQVLSAMYDQFPLLYEDYSSYPSVSTSLEDVDLYVSVARSLLENTEYLPRLDQKEAYDAIMAGIAEEKVVFMPLFTGDTINRKIDFGQFKPRGHYTDIVDYSTQHTLEHYFKTMMWLGRIDFFLTSPPEEGMPGLWNPDELIRMNISALILNELLYSCGKKELLDANETALTYLIGESDNLTPDELHALSGSMLSSPLDLLDPAMLEAFKNELERSDDYGQKIMSNFFYVDVAKKNPAGMPISFRLLGQKFIIDSYIFHHVVYDRIIYNDEAVWRPLPDPLDILSVLGSEDAMALMANEMEKFHYAYKVNEVKYLVDSYDDSYWSSSLYTSWLAAIRDLNPPETDNNLPYFMKTTAWHHEKINTQLTSWAQLRHDNILYAKQSYTGGTSCSFPYTYVEPYPDFYRRLENYALDAADFYPSLLDGIDDTFAALISSYYTRYAEIMSILEEIAIRELERQPLDEDQLTFLKTMINEYMASGPYITGWLNDLYFPAMDQFDFDFTVADVHTQPTDRGGAPVGNVLHVGNGKLNLGVFIAPGTVTTGRNMCYVGPVGSFHSLVKTDFYRLDDEEWRSYFMGGEVPPRPDWAYHYLADRDGAVSQPDNVLKGTVYSGTNQTASRATEPVYLLLYPNPAADALHIRFIIEKAQPVRIDVFDITGRHAEAVLDAHLSAAEHDVAIATSEYMQGMYLLVMQVGESMYARRFIIE